VDQFSIKKNRPRPSDCLRENPQAPKSQPIISAENSAIPTYLFPMKSAMASRAAQYALIALPPQEIAEKEYGI
jgi:hypothetical protein